MRNPVRVMLALQDARTQGLTVTIAIGIALASAAGIHAQGIRGVPRPAAPEAQQERQRPDPPVFRAAVTRVEVSALVLDRDGKPLRGLTSADFEVLENGVPQTIRSFTPFTYDSGLLVLPDPVLDRPGGEKTPASTVASNLYTAASRVFVLILDDLHIDVRRTEPAVPRRGGSSTSSRRQTYCLSQ